MHYEFMGEVLRWPANPAIFLVNLPASASAEIAEVLEGLSNGFGSYKVEVRVGLSTWRTSIFPDSKSGLFALPLKAEIRKRHDLSEGSTVTVSLTILGL